MSASLPLLSLYVHLPWCARKCPYCDFNSHTAGQDAPFVRYVDALKIDLARERERAAGRPLVSVFLGGGTPSLFSANAIAEILGEGLTGFALAPDCEITMEANPGTLECGRLVEYRDAGVTRLSIGAQSFSSSSLHALGRIHGPEEVRTAYAEASEAGFASINLDLMFALPGQDLAAAVADVDELIGLSPPHVSYYQLTLEPNTVFYSRPPQGLPDNDEAYAIQETCHARLADAGYRQYEISAFARDGHECRHNINYWRFGDYLAVGAGAHGKLTDDSGVIWRYRKAANPLLYMQQAEVRSLDDSLRRLPDADAGFEFMLNALRLRDGFSAADFSSRTGLEFASVRSGLESLAGKGLMANERNDHWCPTELGYRHLNELQAQFLPG